MHFNRSLILIVLAILTICFLGAAYTLWFNPTGLPLVGQVESPNLVVEPPSTKPGDAQKVKLTISETGITAVTASQLKTAGLLVSELSSDQLSLTHNGEPVPFLVQDNGKESTLYFYAQAEEDPHKPLAVYELQPGHGLSMLERNAQPFNEGGEIAEQFLDWEEDVLFVEDGQPGDAWMGDLLLAPDRWYLVLNNIHSDGEPATLTVNLFTNVEAQGDDQHHVEVRVNGQSLGDHSWQGAGEEIIRLPIGAGVLMSDQTNTVELLVLDDTAPAGEGIYVDSLELTFEGPINVTNGAITFRSDAPNIRVDGAGEDFMVFNISDPALPLALYGARSEGDSAHFSAGARDATYIALNSSNSIKPVVESVPAWRKSLFDPDWEPDYIAIVADVAGFEEALEPLLLHRRDQELAVARVSVEQIYDEFGYGHRDPQAIKDFIFYAIENWGTSAPQYILLVGDANYDVTNMTVGKNRNRLPTWVAYSEDAGYVADDSWFTLDDEGQSQIAIGRFPAQNAPQLRAMVQKTIAYETAASLPDAAWTEKALLIAGEEPGDDEEIAAMTGALSEDGYSVYDLYLDGDENTNHKIMSAMNDGVSLIYYLGQGSESAWGTQAILQNTDTQGLRNSPNLPLLTTFTSPSGAFAHPSKDSLAESLLRAPNGGIIAAIAPSGTISAAFEPRLAALFYEQLTTPQANRLGISFRNMYNDAARDSPALQEAMAAINLLGDPALLVAGPAGNTTDSQ
ncbi:MAG: C25 family cysteine peptidase [Candidatus Promineifilaceae bacterium]|jgi:hypothetical protein